MTRSKAIASCALAAMLAACGTSGEASNGSTQPPSSGPSTLPLFVPETAPATVSNPSQTLPAPIQLQEEPSLPVEVLSADGSTVTVTDSSRVVPLFGNLAEIVFGLGLGDRVVARDVSATFVEAADLPLVTRGHDVSAESVLSLRPTLVLAQTDTGPAEALDQIRNAGVPVLVLETPTSLDDAITRIRLIAAALGVPAAGEALADRTAAEIAAALADIPDVETPPTVAFLYVRGGAGVYLLGGPGSGTDSMIDAVGGVDAGTAIGLERAFTPLTSEALVVAAPDAIIVTTTGLQSVGGIDGLLALPGVAQTPAGRDRRIIAVEDGLLYSFGARTPEALAVIAQQLYATR